MTNSNQLTYREFCADMVRSLRNLRDGPGKLQPLWLALCEDLQADALLAADDAFSEWKEREENAEASRERLAREVLGSDL